jgi:hypothetical protein
VNPAHLFLGTNADNLQDMHHKGRGRVHSLTPEESARGRAKAVHHYGEQHHSTKFSDATVEAIRQEYAAGGVTCAQLGLKYGVSPEHTRRLVKGRWRVTPTTAQPVRVASGRK